ncbi:MAG TPA: GFA family protein [Ensifer sp.]|nr:GFA family protein [Ensifer sp.]
MTSITCQCRCGAVSLSIDGAPVTQLYCHCEDCQNAHRAAYAPAAIFPKEQVQVSGAEMTPRVIRSTERMFCRQCGTYLFSEIVSVGMRSVSAYLLPKGMFKPQFHVQCDEAMLPVCDNLPHYRRFPAAFGGAEEFVDW